MCTQVLSKRLTVWVIRMVMFGVLVVARPASAQTPTPPEGTTLVAMSPVNAEVIYAAAGRTLYRSDDGSQTWAEVTSLPSVISALQPANHSADLVYAGTESAGIWRSFDRGLSWQTSDKGLGMDPGVILGVSALGLDPQDDSLLYAATGYWLGTSQVRFSPAAIMLSSDNGATWLPLARVPLGSQSITSLYVDASQSLSVVATAVDGTTARYTASMDEMIAYRPAAEASPAQQAAAARSLDLLASEEAAGWRFWRPRLRPLSQLEAFARDYGDSVMFGSQVLSFLRHDTIV